MDKVLLVEDEVNIASFIKRGSRSSDTKSPWPTTVKADGTKYRTACSTC